MKSVREIIKETVEKPKSQDEKRFIDLHRSELDDKTPQDEDSYTAGINKAKRLADKDDDEATYDMAYGDGEDDELEDFEDDLEDMVDDEDEDDEDDLEEEMTKAQMDKREEIVKSMKDKQADFKKRYGDNWKEVMYATANKLAMKEEVELSEAVIDSIEKIVSNKQAKSVKFADGGSLRVDATTANVLMKIYDALNDANKKKFEDALNKNETMFMKMVDFAFSKVK